MMSLCGAVKLCSVTNSTYDGQPGAQGSFVSQDTEGVEKHLLPPNTYSQPSSTAVPCQPRASGCTPCVTCRCHPHSGCHVQTSCDCKQNGSLRTLQTRAALTHTLMCTFASYRLAWFQTTQGRLELC